MKFVKNYDDEENDDDEEDADEVEDDEEEDDDEEDDDEVEDVEEEDDEEDDDNEEEGNDEEDDDGVEDDDEEDDDEEDDDGQDKDFFEDIANHSNFAGFKKSQKIDFSCSWQNRACDSFRNTMKCLHGNNTSLNYSPPPPPPPIFRKNILVTMMGLRLYLRSSLLKVAPLTIKNVA